MSDEEQIRRLLADARHDEPIPPDVAGRMDGVLADLRADRTVRPTVTDLATARRRRRVRTLLVAAAAVVVAGIGIDQLRVADLGSGSADSANSANDGGAGVAGSAREQPEAASGGALSAEPGPRPGPAVRLDPDRFARQVARLQGGATASYDMDQDRVQDALGGARCRAPGAGRVVPVVYDRAPGLLVYRPPSGDTQVVDLILCGHPGITRTITLPAP